MNNDDPQLDQEIWQAWVRKNEAKDLAWLAKRNKLLMMAVILGIAAFVLWRFVS